MTDPWTTSTGSSPTARRHRWWWIAATAVMTVVAVIVTTSVLSRIREAEGRGVWQSPEQTFLTDSLQVALVPGWRASVTDLGLPAGEPGTDQLSKIDATDTPRRRRPFIGYLGDRAYFLATGPGVPTRQWWLAGIDVTDGHRLFPAVLFTLQTDYPPDCFRNGPTMLLCVYAGSGAPRTVWVVDAHSGAVMFTGPTDLNSSPGHNWIEQVGDYAVARTKGKGVSGIGAHGELTWFVPGDGSVGLGQLDNSDLPPQTFTSQGSVDRRSFQKVTFSVVDGTIITPQVDPGLKQQSVVVHPGGFVSELSSSGQTVRSSTGFFDTTGKQLGELARTSVTTTSWQDVPVLHQSAPSNYWASTADGKKLADISLDGAVAAVRLVGSRLFVSDRPNYWDAWRQYDLATGAQAKSCSVGMYYEYLGSHDATAVFTFGDPGTGIGIVARDLDTCETRWRVEPQAGSLRRVWRVNTTLVELSADGTELFSLCAPR